MEDDPATVTEKTAAAAAPEATAAAPTPEPSAETVNATPASEGETDVAAAAPSETTLEEADSAVRSIDLSSELLGRLVDIAASLNALDGGSRIGSDVIELALGTLISVRPDLVPAKKE
jgi:hypothetical protein